MKILILGMGNTLLSDDGIGIVIANKLQEIHKGNEFVDVRETSWGGFRIIDLLSGYDSAIIIDALKTGEQPVGTIRKFTPSDFVHSVRMTAFHDINFVTALQFAQQLDIPMPSDISVYTIEVAETELISENLTPGVRSSVERCVKEIQKEINAKIKNMKMICIEERL